MKYSPNDLLDLRFPAFTARHVFTAKLRLVILVGFWFLCVVFYPGLVTLEQPIMLIVSMTFVVTTICYSFILKGIGPVFFFIIELAADVAAQTVLVYLTGGIHSNFFTVYIIYCVSGGLFYNYRVSAVIALLVGFFYIGLFLATQWGWISGFAYPFEEGAIFAWLGPYRNVSLLGGFLLITIYGIRIASYFTKLREKILEEKHRELIALNDVSSLTRSVITLERVIAEVIRAVVRGLGYDAGFLLFHDEEQGKIKIFADEESPFVGLHLPSGDKTNLVYQAMRKKKTIIRYEWSEVLKGTEPPLRPGELAEMQKKRSTFGAEPTDETGTFMFY